MRRWCVWAALWALVVPVPPLAAQSAGRDYAWVTGDLALTLPPGWMAAADDPVLRLENGAARLFVVTTPPIAPADLLTAFMSALAAADYLLLDYAIEPLWGQPGIRANVLTADRSAVGRARAGRAPDGRLIVLGGGAPQSARADWDTAFADVFASLSFSVRTAPTPRRYQPVWSTAGVPNVIALAASAEIVYAVTAERGVIALSTADGAIVRETPFANPAQPTGIAVSGDSVVIADTVCRCLRRLTTAGTWSDPLGTFGGNAPVHLAADAAGTLYAIDLINGSYALHILTGTHGRIIPLTFNAAAPPLVAVDPSGAVTVIEWLASLLDGTVSGALTRVTDTGLTLRDWLAVPAAASAEAVRDFAAFPDGSLLLVGTDGRITRRTADEGTQELLRLTTPPRAAAITPHSTLAIADAAGMVTLYRSDLPPDRAGAPLLADGVPVIGTVNAAAPRQEWAYRPQPGERVTLNAIDPSGWDAVDMAIRVIAPNGREIAYNDDHTGLDFGDRYAAQIRDLVLTEPGEYVVQVDYVQGSGGTYALILTRDRGFTLGSEPSSSHTLAGRVFDAQPVERWIFNGIVGQILTLTMLTTSGNLDPALTLRDPYGALLAYNDDGRDPELGLNAQIFRVTLPIAGQYVIEAGRFAESGEYTLIIALNG